MPIINRMKSVQDEMYQLFYTLYGDRPGFNESYSQLQDLLAVSLKERPQRLKALDQQRSKDKDWLLSEKWVGMALYVDRYNKDLLGLLDKVDYLKELGINLVHIMPIMESPEGKSDGGYAIKDYLKVDDKYGTNEDLDLVINTFHDNGISIIMDLVINHTSDEHEWARRAKQGRTFYQELYLMYDNEIIPKRYEECMPEIFPESSPGNFVYDPALGKWIFSTFHSYQWDLNYKNPMVFINMLGNLLDLLNMGVDIVRLDAPAFIWKELGTNCQNLPAVHTILQLFKLCTRVVAPGTALLSEAIVEPREILKYFGGNKQECDIAYNALFMDLLWDIVSTQNNKLLLASLGNILGKPQGTTWLNYVRCHDDIGLGYEDEPIYRAGYTPFDHRQFILKYLTGNYTGSFAKGAYYMYDPKTKDARVSGSLASLAGLEKGIQEEKEHEIELAIRRIVLLHSLIFSIGGMPMLYYGDEWGMLNDYSYRDDPQKSSDNRWMHRPVIDWEQAARYREEGTIENRIFSQLQQLIRIRQASPEFADHNNLKLIDLKNPQLFGFVRSYQNACTIIICNLSIKKQVVSKVSIDHLRHYFPKGFYDKLTGKKMFEMFNKVELLPYSFLWIGNSGEG